MGRHARLAALADLGAARRRPVPVGAGGAARGAAAHRPLSVADLGCGSGRTVSAVLEAADALGPAAPGEATEVVVHAVDQVSALDERLLVDPRVRSRTADLDAPLPFADASLDVAVSLNVLEHLVDPVGHLVAAHRVLVPGGTLVLAHSDWDTALFTSPDDGLTRTLVDRFVAARTGGGPQEGRGDGFSGRKLLAHAGASAERGAPWSVLEVASWADPHRRFDDGSLAWKVATGMLSTTGDDPVLSARAAGWVEGLRSLAGAGRFLFTVTDVALVLRREETAAPSGSWLKDQPHST